MKDNFFLLHEKFQEICLKYPKRLAVRTQARDLTFKDIYELSLKVASWLISGQFGKGGRIAIIAENSGDWISIYFGILSAGCIAVPLDPHISADEIGNFLKDCQAKAVFIDAKIFEPGKEIFKEMRFLKGIVVVGGDFSEIKNINTRNLKLPSASIEDTASILYTSGTTAIPKGVMLSHKNFSANFKSIAKLNLCGKEDVFISVLPFYHAYAFMATLIFPLFLGAKIVFPASLKARDLTDSMKKEKVTILVGVPELFYNLHKAIFQEIKNFPFLVRFILNKLLTLNYWLRRIIRVNLGKIFFGPVHSKAGGNLGYMVSGGARLEPAIAWDLFKLGFSVLEGYGLSETSPIVCLNPAGRQKFGSVGKVLSGVEIKIIKPDNEGVGEVAIRGENVFKGYYNLPEETANSIKDGWFYSGDLGFLDKNGYLHLTGRSKEVIVLSSGKNIYPEEIEEYYKKTNVVKELCVLEAKNDKGIVSLQAVVVPNFDYFEVAEGGNIFRKIKWEFENISYNLPAYKRISGFILTKDDLPRTALGKIKRYEVKNRYLKDFGEKQEILEEKKEMPLEDLKLLGTDIAKKVLDFLKNALSLKDKPKLDDHLELDLGVDSLAKVELVSGLEKLFNISIPDALAAQISNVRQAIIKLIELLATKTGPTLKPDAIEPSWQELLLIEPSDEIKRKITLDPSVFNKLFTFTFSKLLFMIFRLSCKFKVEGGYNIPKEGNFIFCANHASYLDGLVVAAAAPFYVLPNLYFIGWKQIFEHPALKWANKIARLVPIDSSAELMNTMQIAGFLIRNKKSICIFPEGQRTIDGKIQEFRKGIGILVKELGMPVVPLAIKGTFEAWPRTKGFPKTYPIKVVFGKPITSSEILSKIPKGTTQSEYELIADYLREEVAKLF